jgi:hypothetical protein
LFELVNSPSVVESILPTLVLPPADGNNVNVFFFVIEELDFPDTRKDMNEDNEQPTLREILYLISQSKEFFSKYVSEEDKNYFIKNFNKIHFFKGNFNEIAIIEKK